METKYKEIIKKVILEALEKQNRKILTDVYQMSVGLHPITYNILFEDNLPNPFHAVTFNDDWTNDIDFPVSFRKDESLDKPNDMAVKFFPDTKGEWGIIGDGNSPLHISSWRRNSYLNGEKIILQLREVIATEEDWYDLDYFLKQVPLMTRGESTAGENVTWVTLKHFEKFCKFIGAVYDDNAYKVINVTGHIVKPIPYSDVSAEIYIFVTKLVETKEAINNIYERFAGVEDDLLDSKLKKIAGNIPLTLEIKIDDPKSLSTLDGKIKKAFVQENTDDTMDDSVEALLELNKKKK